MSLTITAHLKFKPPKLMPSSNYHPPKVFPLLNFTRKPILQRCCTLTGVRNPISVSTRVCSVGGQAENFAADEQSPASDFEGLGDNSSNSKDSYVGLFVRMLGLDNDSMDREQAVIALWKYSLDGKHCVDNIMKFDGTVNLVVNLLKSNSDPACEAAAGLLSVLSSVHVYRDAVAVSGAIEEIAGLLIRHSLSSNVKEQAICTLWNLSVDENVRASIVNSEILPLLIKSLEDEEKKIREAAGGVLANLILSHSNHKVMVEAGVIPKLAKILNNRREESKVIKKIARSALLELAKDEYYRILMLEEGLVVVPLVGAAAYKSFKPALYSWPSLPDGTEIEQRAKGPSKYGASELLLGLNIDSENAELEEAKMKAAVGRTQQQFLARIGAIETEEDSKPYNEQFSGQKLTILPWVDGVARLVLIIGLEDSSAIARAAMAIADASINEHMRIAFKEAGAVKNLVQLITHPSDSVRLAAIRALDRLSISHNVCHTIEAEGVLYPLVNLLKQSSPEISDSLTTMMLNILSRILDPNKEMKSMFYGRPLSGLKEVQDVTEHRGSADGNGVTPSKLTSSVQTITGEDLVDPTFISCLVNILKTSNPDLQRKVCSILEFVVVTEPNIEKLLSAEIGSGVEAVLQQKTLLETRDGEEESRKEEIALLELEESGLAVSAAARLLTKLLDYNPFLASLNLPHFAKLLRAVLVSEIPVQNKEWVAACLYKLSSHIGPNPDFENPVNLEVTVYETIPRLLEAMKSWNSGEVRETAVVELNRIISEGLVDSTRAVGNGGGIFTLVELMEKGSERAVESSLSILYNLSMDSENHAAIIAAGALPVLRRLVLSQGPHWMRALRLLQTLPT